MQDYVEFSFTILCKSIKLQRSFSKCKFNLYLFAIDKNANEWTNNNNNNENIEGIFLFCLYMIESLLLSYLFNMEFDRFRNLTE